ncbi:diacylglycerol O-acyltransferase 1, partial [Teratosphaeriaceae sp. CCFEE 6253]
MIANNSRFTPNGVRGKPSPIRPKSGIMSLDLEIADAIARQEQLTPTMGSFPLPPEDGLMAAGDESVDEDSIKETPPRSNSARHRRQGSSEPRPLGEVMDEADEFDRRSAGSPSLRHVRGRLEEEDSWEREDRSPRESYVDAVTEHFPAEDHDAVNGIGAPPIPPRAHPTLIGNAIDPAVAADGKLDGGGVGGTASPRIREEGLEHISEEGTTTSSESDAPIGLAITTNGTNGFGNGMAAKHAIQGTHTPDTYEAVGEDESPRSPVRKAHKRVSSRSLNGSAKKQQMQPISEQHDDATQSAQHEDEHVSPKGTTNAPDFLSLESSSADESQAPTEVQHTPSELQPQIGGLVYENLRNKSGENLASIRPSDEFMRTLSLSQHEAPPPKPDRPGNAIAHRRQDSELVSGRRAGAGWSRSAIRW